jgi:hypothetical protein
MEEHDRVHLFCHPATVPEYGTPGSIISGLGTSGIGLWLIYFIY